jgi:group I intron endonuclease
MAESGIYEIINLVNGKRYVGSAVRIEGRWKEHRRDLRAGRHKNRHLQNAWIKYGEAAFEFRVLEIVPRLGLLIEREQAHLDRGYDYNISPTAGSPLGVKHSLEICAKKSEISRRLWADPAHREKMMARAGPDITDEFREAVRKGIADRIAKGLPFARGVRSYVGRATSEETKEKLRAHNLGKRHTGDARRKMSEARRGKLNARAITTVFTIEHISGARLSGVPIDLRAATGIEPSLMCGLLKGRAKTTKGWRLISSG